MEHRISFPDLKSYIVSSRDCHFLPHEIQLEPKTGEIIFDFSAISNRGLTEIWGRKVSGSGQIILLHDNSETFYTFYSRKNEKLSLDLFFSSLVRIARPNSALGKIALSEIKITDSFGEDVKQWKQVIRQVGQHSKLSLRGEKLFAAQGAKIEAHNISALNTNPSNCFRLTENKFYFFYQ